MGTANEELPQDRERLDLNGLDDAENIDLSNFDPFEIYECCGDKSRTLHIKVLKGRNITQGRLNDLFDTPDPYVRLEVLGNPAGSKRTAAQSGKNPEWKEKFEFVVKPGKDQVLKISVYDEDVVSADDVIHATEFKLSTLRLGKVRRVSLKFRKVSVVDLELLLVLDKEDDMRHGLELCEEEKLFIEKRKQVALTALQHLLGEDGPANEDEMPRIAVMGSGGGFRALMGYCGAFIGLKKSGILDTALYTVAVSGSTWYQAQLYSHEQAADMSLQELKHTIRYNMTDKIDSSYISYHLKPTRLLRYMNVVKQKKKRGQPTSFTDLFGLALRKTFLQDNKGAKLSDQRKALQNARLPLPIYASLNVKDNVSEQIYNDDIEFTPFEVGLPKYGIFMKPEQMANKFYAGKAIEKHDEHPLHYLMGTWGSAYTISLTRLVSGDQKVSVDVDDDEEDAKAMKVTKTELETLNNERANVLNKWDEHVYKKAERRRRGGSRDAMPGNGKSDVTSDSDTDSDMETLTSDIHISEVDNDQEQGTLSSMLMNILLSASSTLRSRASRCGVIFNPLLGLDTKKVYPFKTVPNSSLPYGEVFEPMPNDIEHMYMADAGLTLNCPFPMLLRPQRQIDVIICFDFSNRTEEEPGYFDNILLTEEWAKVHRVRFPAVDEKALLANGVQECYVIEDKDDPHCPIIIDFPVDNVTFKRFKQPGVERETDEELEFADFNVFMDPAADFSTLNFSYDTKSFDRLTALMEYNVLNNIPEIKTVLKNIVKRKRMELAGSTSEA